jgi:glycosyltransferase involved in cell wall biosynthesis
MTKVIIQMPAYNEEKTLAFSLSQLPRTLEGVDTVEWLIINDGSEDNTVQIALDAGVDHVVSFVKNQGLAKAFMAGIESGLKHGADIIVNTDADNQYHAGDIQKLINPILEKRAEIVIGERPISKTAHFSPIKKLLQKLGSMMIRLVSDTSIPDAPSGFRAISRNAATQLNVFNEYTYTLEMIIQAGKKGMAITSVPVRTNEDLRPSKLVKSIPNYIKKSILTMIRIFNTYNPMSFFLRLGAIPLIIGIGLGIRWVLFFMGKGHSQHIPSLILAALLILLGMQFWIFSMIADLISVNRKLLEDVQKKTREQLFDS